MTKLMSLIPFFLNELFFTTDYRRNRKIIKEFIFNYELMTDLKIIYKCLIME